MGLKQGFLLAALGLLAACGTPDVPNGQCTAFARDGTLTISAQDSGSEALAIQGIAESVAGALSMRVPAVPRAAPTEGLTAPLRARVIVPVNLLAITTGGQYGAFSSGVLAGWTAVGKPEFRMVTGASAGSLVAPVAFAGSDYDALLPLNANISETDVVRKRPLFEVLRQSSLYDTARLRARLRGAYGNADGFVARMKERADGGAVLLTGATNIDTGRFVTFDLSAMLRAEQNPAAQLDCIVETTMASSAIPLIFPPQRIAEDLFSDSGVRQHVFLVGIGRGVAAAERRLSARSGADIRFRVNAYVLVNSDLTFESHDTGARIDRIGLRTFEIVNDEGLRQSLLRTVALAKGFGWKVRALWPTPGMSETCGLNGQSKASDSPIFDPKLNGCLFDEGKKLIGSPGFRWRTASELREAVEKGRVPE